MKRLLLVIFILSSYQPIFAVAARKAAPPSSPEEADIEKIRERYWAQGRDSEMGVIQQRLYPRRHRLELGVGGGILLGDPFLSVKTVGAGLGFHISESIAIQVLYLKDSVSPSSALTTLRSRNATADTNEPREQVGGEVQLSVIHGKLASVGSGMAYLDVHVSAGAGRIRTESGSNLFLSLGAGQQVRISRPLALNLNYRLIGYGETLVGKASNNLGQNLGVHTNLSHSISLGLSLFLNVFGAD